MRLNEFLDHSGLSMTRFAKDLGTTTATISRIADGQVMPRRQLLERICKFTEGQVSPCDLLRLEASIRCRIQCGGNEPTASDQV